MNNKVQFFDLKGWNPKLYYQRSNIVSIADDIVNGTLHVQARSEAPKYNLDNMEWNYDGTGSFQTYLQGLNMIGTLAMAFIDTKDKKYIELAWKFLKSWYAYYEDEEKIKQNIFVFKDHPVALRVENLILLGKASHDSKYVDGCDLIFLKCILLECGIWLFDDNNYTYSHNHGIMEDEALLHLGYLFDNNLWISKAKDRLITQKQEAFTEEWVHTENSPAYAFLVTKLFVNIGNFLIANGDKTYGQSIISEMKKAEQFKEWTVKPDGLVAQIGDSQFLKGTYIRHNEKHIIYPQSGYYFYCSGGGQYS